GAAVGGRRRVRETGAQEGQAGRAPAAADSADRAHLVPAVPGVVSAAEVMATGRSIAAVQEPSGAIGWPDGHTDAWNHVECAMALSACGLREPARHAYRWLPPSPPAAPARPQK